MLLASPLIFPKELIYLVLNCFEMAFYIKIVLHTFFGGEGGGSVQELLHKLTPNIDLTQQPTHPLWSTPLAIPRLGYAPCMCYHVTVS